MTKTLLFEGAGYPEAEISKATIGNCRIRTACHLDDGTAVFLEIMAGATPKNGGYIGYITHAYKISDDMPNNDESLYNLHVKNTTIDYTFEGILDFVNSLGASYDSIQVISDGYRVFADEYSNGRPVYNYVDEYIKID